MSRPSSHTHACAECGQRYPCDGDQFRNYDGWPEVVCQDYHVRHLNVCHACRTEGA